MALLIMVFLREFAGSHSLTSWRFGCHTALPDWQPAATMCIDSNCGYQLPPIARV